MVVRSKRKSRKLRGRSRYMGWGQIGQHRKAGSRGGVGAAGMHKHKWSWVVKYAPDWYGKRGFKSPKQITREVRAINVGELSEKIESLVREGKASVLGEVYEVDLSELGYDKLLGEGDVRYKMRVKVESATKRAIEKVKQAGGEVILVGGQ